ncbi:hypothetical protein Trichorick_01404 (plasmid) [Candidatus Trichorickettsia mobilis]|uniref:Uncharacterized protein n=1 Tax=Candidatus Trichorickettsia mobilis TaxID=1346319 RepID=A0ABZ0UUL1_9RICK|nr:hypothetical protein [Candidatus Trichorickettsia mobilis]WPY01491.1 hypothetical protein Trichorick_01404 [Candidatus Trichorickettsia mobilis]
MKNDDNNEVIKIWAWIVLIVLMLTPFILKAVKNDKKPIKDNTALSEAYRYRH